MDTADRLFLIIDPHTRALVDHCHGPLPSGRCPAAESPPYRCSGMRVMPRRGSAAAGLPFTITDCQPGRCPLAWADRLA